MWSTAFKRIALVRCAILRVQRFCYWLAHRRKMNPPQGARSAGGTPVRSWRRAAPLDRVVLIKVRLWHKCEVRTSSEIFCLSGKSGSDRRVVESTRLLRLLAENQSHGFGSFALSRIKRTLRGGRKRGRFMSTRPDNRNSTTWSLSEGSRPSASWPDAEEH